MAEKNLELVFIPFPVLSHLVAAVKLAKLLIDRDECLSITVFIFKLPTDTKIDSYTKNLLHHSRICFVQIPHDESTVSELMKSPRNFMFQFMESQKKTVRDAVSEIMEDLKSSRVIAGFVIDMFCTTMIDVADEFGIPTYIWFTGSAATLGLTLHFQSLSHDFGQDLTEYEDSDAEMLVSAYVNPLPARVLPSLVFEKDGDFLNIFKKFRRSKGIVINTFLELEHHAVRSLLHDENIPKVYPVGPIIQADEDQTDEKKKGHDEIIEWLDMQPDSSVVYLCFGSNGYFESDQVKEIAIALEKSGYRFLWSLRKPPPDREGKFEFAGEYDNPEVVLPKGFLQRTSGIGKVIGWAPQMAVLSHPSVGGFVSHCGWNSSLESVWCGVPIAAWPLFAEQQANAFQFVKEFGMAVEIKMDYRADSNEIVVEAEKIEKGIREVMELENEIRIQVKAMKENSRMAKMEGQSSHNFLGSLVQDFIKNIS